MLSKVITISQQKGGTGKTTLAIHLAMGFIKFQNLKVAVVDTDPQGSLGQWFMIRSEKNISNDNLSFKTASLWGAQYESKNLKKDHDIVIIDTPPKIESDARPSIEASDLVLIPKPRIAPQLTLVLVKIPLIPHKFFLQQVLFYLLLVWPKEI